MKQHLPLNLVWGLTLFMQLIFFFLSSSFNLHSDMHIIRKNNKMSFHICFSRFHNQQCFSSFSLLFNQPLLSNFVFTELFESNLDTMEGNSWVNERYHRESNGQYILILWVCEWELFLELAVKSWTDSCTLFKSGTMGVAQKTPLAARGKALCVGVMVSVNSKKVKQTLSEQTQNMGHLIITGCIPVGLTEVL